MSNEALVGMNVGTAIMPGPGTVIGAAVGGLVSLFTGPEAQQQAASIGGRSIDARQIWEQINPGNADSLREGATSAGHLQTIHKDRVDQINAINQAMDAAWQGDASAQAQAGAHPLGIWLDDSASNLVKSKTYLDNQGDAFDTVHAKVQEIAATPPHAGFIDHINPFSDKDDEIEKYNQQGQTNVEAFNAYYQASAQNAAGMPQYSAWEGNNFSDDGKNDNGADDDKTPGDNGRVPGTGVPGGYQPGNTGNIPGTGGSIPGTGSGGNYGNLPGTGNGGNYGNTPGTGGYTPSTPGYTSPGYQSPSWNDGTSAAGYTPSTPTSFDPSTFGPAGSGYTPSTFGGGSGSGSGSGSGVSGIGGFGPGGSGAGGLGSGSSTGAGAGSGAAGAVGGGAAVGAAGAAGRAGMGGVGAMGGAGRGKGGDDEEHQNRFLVDEDPNELFGTDELTAPPVIGE